MQFFIIINHREILDRQKFIKSLAGIPLFSSMDYLDQLFNSNQQVDLISDEEFWIKIRKQFYLDDQILDFRCHAASPLPTSILDHFLKEYKYIQAFPSSRNHEIEPAGKEPLRVAVAKELNCSIGELAIMRSTTEALNNVIMGFPFQKGDEVIGSVHEYDSMFASLYQQQLRLGITVKQVEIPYQPESTAQILDIWRKSITPRTKMFLISHIVWISGQIYPVKEICALAKEYNIYTVIDAAQSFSHIPVDVLEMDCDYLGGCLHKWAAAPLGTGFLYIKRENIGMTMPLMANYQFKANDEVIEKFENFGATTPVFNTAAKSLEFWGRMGNQLKTERMHFLKMYWTHNLKSLPEIGIQTNLDKTDSCGIAYFQVKNRNSREVGKMLKEKYNVSVQVIQDYKNDFVDYRNVDVLGIATPVFITTRQLDRLYEVMKEIIILDH